MTRLHSHFVTRGYDIPLAGAAPATRIELPDPDTVAARALIGMGVRWRALVREGDRVRRGDPVMESRRGPRLSIAAPAAGQVISIRRGERRAPSHVVIARDGSDRARDLDLPGPRQVATVSGDELVDRLGDAGLLSLFRQRPLGRAVSSPPDAVFVNAMDTEPLAAEPGVLLEGRDAELAHGLALVRRLCAGPVYVTIAPKVAYPEALTGAPGVEAHEFVGPHPAGLPGTHINAIAPQTPTACYWTIRAADVAYIGEAALGNALPSHRLVAVAGPRAPAPGYYRVHAGAPVAAVAGELAADTRLIAGTVLSGTAVDSDDYLAASCHTLTLIGDGEGQRSLFGWILPRLGRPSAYRAAFNWLWPQSRYAIDARLNGEARPLVNLGTWDKVVPLDVHVAYLVRAIQAGDLEEALQLGLLDVIEEDVALCSFVDPCKLDVGAVIREGLELYAREENLG